MPEFNKDEEIKKLIKSGFDLELISFELDIPIEEIKRCKQDLDKSKDSNNKSNKPVKSRMQQIKERYEELFFKTEKKVEVKTKRGLKPKEIKTIDNLLAEIEKILEGMKQTSRDEKYESAKNILLKVKKIEEYPLTREQLERLHTLIRISTIRKIEFKCNTKYGFYCSQEKEIYNR